MYHVAVKTVIIFTEVVFSFCLRKQRTGQNQRRNHAALISGKSQEKNLYPIIVYENTISERVKLINKTHCTFLR